MRVGLLRTIIVCNDQSDTDYVTWLTSLLLKLVMTNFDSFFRMGSFTSKSAIPPTWDSDLDSLGLETITNSETLLQLCSEQLRNMPEPFKRSWVSRKKTRPSHGSPLRTSSADLTKDHKLLRKTNSRSLSFETCIHNENGCRTDEEGTSANDENIRIFQWNALSQSKSI